MYVKQLLEGLRFLNKLHFIHHDLKPANIVINKKGYLKLIDFGATVRATRAWQQAEHLTSTPVYTPPEADCCTPGKQRFSMAPRNSGTSFDTFAAGLIWLEMICPNMSYRDWYKGGFAANNDYGVGKKAIKSAKKLCPDLSVDANTDLEFIGQMLNDDPELRPPPYFILERKPLSKAKNVTAPVEFPDSPPPPRDFSPADGPPRM
eukprot:TRINITY_DN18753_c0_g1_i4.p2 TRINITY_DN18753_c0_g1~~TRINITY_DN18753_c0_g1_i4.p2  ORF type:complete len:205 (+),score=40.00 TRINITY_DN18753_c0_g1_i4:150-764(+)